MKRACFLFLLLACSLAAHTETPRQDISIRQRMIVLESDGSRLKVNELYTVRNNSDPSRTKAAQRALEIYLPDGAAVQQATARSDAVKSVKTTLVPQAEKNRYAFTYPVHPGQTQFTVTYTLPYNGQLRINPRVTRPTAQLMLVAPDTIRLIPEDNSVFAPANDPMLKNVSVYVASDVTPQLHLGFEVQGSGSLARSQKEGQAATSPQRSSATGTRRSGNEAGVPNQGTADAAPSQWIFLAVLFLFLAAGAMYVYSVNHSAPPVSVSPPAPSLLAEMKEEMFQLETDRLQGKLSPEEYAAAKAALDKAMRKAVERAGRP